MDKIKLKRIMAESALLRESALESFLTKLHKKSYAEAKKVFKEMGVEDEEDLKKKVMDGDIVAEELDMPVEEEPGKENTEEEEDKVTDMEKLVTVMESLIKRVEALEGEEEPKKGEEVQKGDVSSGEDPKAGDMVDGTKKDSEVDKDVSAGKLPESVEEPKKDEVMVEEAEEEEELKEDGESEEEKEEELPQPPIIKESAKVNYNVEIRKESKDFGKTLNTVFK